MRGVTRRVERTTTIDASAGRPQRLHDFGVMLCLVVPAVEQFKECSQAGDGFAVGLIERGRFAPDARIWRKPARALALAGDFLGDSVPEPLPTFGLSERGRFSAPQSWRASRWFSASRRWSCWPSQHRTGVGNPLPGFQSDRTPLARAWLSTERCALAVCPVVLSTAHSTRV
jgi:hypothetical protein